MGLGLKRDRVLQLMGLSKHDFYYQKKEGKRGFAASTHTPKYVKGEQISVPNEEVVDYMEHRQGEPDLHCGYKRMTCALHLQGYVINRKKVRRLMREHDLLCERPKTAPRNYVKQRRVNPTRPLEVLEMDIKYARVEGCSANAFILTIIDTFTRVVLHWSLGYQMRQEQVQNAWKQVIEQHLQAYDMRRRALHVEVRSDNGSQFRAHRVQKFLEDNGLHQVFTHPYTPEENGHVESFHAILGRALEGHYFENLSQLETRLTLFYERYNNERIHGSTAGLPPRLFWNLWEEKQIKRLEHPKKGSIFKLLIPRHQLSERMSPEGVACHLSKPLNAAMESEQSK